MTRLFRRGSPVVVAGLLLAFVLPQAEAAPGAGAEAFGEAWALLRDGQVEAAAVAFARAARAEPERADYVEEATLARRVVVLRRLVVEQPDAPTWERSVASLHGWYLQHDLPRLAVDVDRQADARRPSPETSLRLAEALLAAGEDVAAANAAARDAGASPRHAVLQAIALARLGRTDAAARLADGLPPPKDLPAADAFDRARLGARLGRTEEALVRLRDAFAATTPSAQPALQARARADADLAVLVTLPAFAEALRTQSKASETCSGGSSCSSCPNRGRCGGSKR